MKGDRIWGCPPVGLPGHPCLRPLDPRSLPEVRSLPFSLALPGPVGAQKGPPFLAPLALMVTLAGPAAPPAGPVDSALPSAPGGQLGWSSFPSRAPWGPEAQFSRKQYMGWDGPGLPLVPGTGLPRTGAGGRGAAVHGASLASPGGLPAQVGHEGGLGLSSVPCVHAPTPSWPLCLCVSMAPAWLLLLGAGVLLPQARLLVPAAQHLLQAGRPGAGPWGQGSPCHLGGKMSQP